MKDPIIIVGGGFGGIFAAKHLLKANLPVLLINPRNYFTFTPLLHEVATGNLTEQDIIFEYESFFHHKQFEFLRGVVDEIDFSQKRLRIGSDWLTYSSIILATGAKTAYYGLIGQEHALPLKSVEDAIAIKRSVIAQAQGKEKHLDINVVGGGPTGVELILELEDLLATIAKNEPHLNYSLHLIQAGTSLLPQYPEKIQRIAKKRMQKRGIQVHLETLAKQVTDHSVITDHKTIPSTLTIWAAGVTPLSPEGVTPYQDERQHIQVNRYLEIKGTQDAYAVGDIITCEEKPVPKLAQTAEVEAAIAAKNIIAKHNGHALTAYTPRVKGMLVSLGFRHGAAHLFGITFAGFFAWWLWRTVYLVKTPGMYNRLRVAFSWTIGLFQGKNVSER